MQSLESGKTTQARDQLAFELDEVKTETSGGDQAKVQESGFNTGIPQ